MPVRYLFGDSVPFPLPFNFLATLEAFMTAATRVVQLELEAQKAAAESQEAAATRQRGVEALEGFHGIVMRVVQDTALKVPSTPVHEYVRMLQDTASRYLDEQKRAALAAADREHYAMRSENERRGQEQRAALDAFLRVAHLPITGSKLSIHQKDGRPSATCVLQNPNSIVTAFRLAPGPAWGQVRRLGDVVSAVELRVGVKKSWLRGTVSPEIVSVDDWIIGRVELADDALELHLRKKVELRDTLVLRVQRGEQGLTGDVQHPGEPGAEAMGGPLAGPDLVTMDRVWKSLVAATAELYDRKEAMLAVQLDGADVFESQATIALVSRLVMLFAPTVLEVAKRSPNAQELSLKVEHEGGRREEIYLRKEELIKQLWPLPGAGREVFAPLGLHEWVPSMTARPPEVGA